MSDYTPINEHKLTKNAKEFLATCRKMKGFSIKRIAVPPGTFSDLLDGVAAHERSCCSDGIPFEGKMLVRK